MAAVSHWLLFGRQEGRVLPARGDPHWASPHPDRIIIDVTSRCELRCRDCNRSCGGNQAPEDADLTPEQIEFFLQESRNADRRWKVIRLEGGEPTLNPRIGDILELLCRARPQYVPGARIILCTSGFGPHAERILSNLPEGVEVVDSGKTKPEIDGHIPFNVAPVDSGRLEGHDFSQGCVLPIHYGIGLTRHGFYPHPICGGIDRVFGLDLGRKTLPAPGLDWSDSCSRLCRLCGFYCGHAVSRDPALKSLPQPAPGEISESWQAAFAHFPRQRVHLSLYGGNR